MSSSTELLRIASCASVVPAEHPDWSSGVTPADRRRSPRIWQLASAAAHKACTAVPNMKPRSVVVATALGALDETRCFLDSVLKEGRGNPRHFIASVHNSISGKLAQEFGADGPCLTVCEAQNSFAAALAVADLLDQSELPCLVVAVDESADVLRMLEPYLSSECREFLRPGWNEGASAFLCTRNLPDKPSVRSTAPLPVESLPADHYCGLITEKIFGSGRRVLPLSQTSSSFLMPAFTAASLVRTGHSGRFVVPSYAPWARTMALVELCV